MKPMDHAEAHERLADLALEPADLDLSGTAEGIDPLRSHIHGCATCRTDLAAWRTTHDAIDDALVTADGDRGRLADLAAEPPIVSPASLRAAIARIPESSEGAAGAASWAAGDRRLDAPTRFGWRRAAALVAAVGVLVVGVALLRDQSARLDAAQAETRELASVTAVLGRVLSDPGHHVVSLASADGTANGSVAWSGHDLAVMTRALERPPAGQTYRCWIERDGVRSPVGEMWFTGDLAYWTGSLDDWATISLDDGGRFGVSLEPAPGGGHGQPVLVADLPGGPAPD